MRPRVVIVTLLLAVAVFGLAGLISRMFHQSPTPAASTVSTASPPVVQTETPVPAAAPTPMPATPVAPAVATVAPSSRPAAINESETDQAEAAQDRVAELMKLAMNDDTESLNTICSELTNSNAEIRAGAVAAVVQFGDRSVSPRLRELAAQTEAPREKVSLLDAADQLDLPPLGSVNANSSPALPQ